MTSIKYIRLCFTLIFIVELVNVIPSSDAHGQMCEPRQRGAYKTAAGRCKYDKDIGQTNVVVDYCPHCVSGGGVNSVSQNLPPNGWAVYDPIVDITTAQRAGLCGDTPTGTDYLLGGKFVPLRYENIPIVNVSRTGGTIDFSIQIDTNHNGYYDFFLCDLDACGTTDIDESCFTNGHCYKLERVAHPTCENPATNTEHFCGPIDEAYPGRWYIPCRAQQIVVGGENGIMRYKLPEGVNCRHCVVQWYWATANSCNPRGQSDYFNKHYTNIQSVCNAIGGGDIASNPGVSECGGTRVPEEFWSCGDIQISADGNSLGDVPVALASPTSSSPPSLSSSASPSASPSPVSVSVSSSPSASASPVVLDATPSASSSPIIVDPTQTPSVTPSASAAGVTETPTPTPSASTSGVPPEQCLDNGAPCDGNVPCCDFQFVCVHTIRAGGFTCKRWTSLWQEVGDRRNAHT